MNQLSVVPAIDARPGLLVFGRDGMLFAQRLDDRRLESVGEPIQLTLFDREGRSVGRVGSPEHMTGFDLSPDGQRAIVARYAPLNTVDQDLWLYETRRDAGPRRLTTAPMLEWFPRWVTNDAFVFTSGEKALGIYRQTVNGDRELLMTARFWPVPSAFPLTDV